MDDFIFACLIFNLLGSLPACYTITQLKLVRRQAPPGNSEKLGAEQLFCQQWVDLILTTP